ncbi:MAG: phosphoglycerate kinase [Bacteroidetes bacterium]|jgi:phosphoglycerate kinase|nr:phosphoglycerate kinase [Bacteroidota bacterium]
MKSIKDLELDNETVLVRVDFNVPMRNGAITDDSRITAAIPTLKDLADRGCKVILLSHLGRPQKDKNSDGSLKREKYSLRLVSERLAEVLSYPITFCSENTGPSVSEAIEKMDKSSFLLLENTRFAEGEKKNSDALAAEWKALASFYINDAFGTAHREHASTVALANQFHAEHKGTGHLLNKEIIQGYKVLNEPISPFIAVIGGSKVSDKIGLLENMVDLADHIIIGGGMAYTFIAAQGGLVGNSLLEEDYFQLARKILNKAKENNTEIHLPEDSVVADRFHRDAKTMTSSSKEIRDEWMGLDIGPDAAEHFRSILIQAGTIIWNGPLGVFEMPPFAKGTEKVAIAISDATQRGAFSLVGGGDSASAVKILGLSDRMSHISTGGGAMLTLLEGKPLPALTALGSD